MSICQGGNGTPFLAQSVYTYLCTGKCTGIRVKHADIPDPVLQFIVQKVHTVPSVCVHVCISVRVYVTILRCQFILCLTCHMQIDDIPDAD